MHPAEQQMQFVFTLRSRGVTNAEVLKAMEATPRDRLPRGHLPRPRLRGHAAADRLRPDDQPADGRRADDPGARGDPALQGARDRHRLGLPGGDPRAGWPGGSTPSSATAGWRGAPASCFQRLGLHNITVVHGDGSLGLPEQAPFDRIIVTAAAEDPPQLLIDQLRDGGIMVLPVGQSNAVQTLIRIVKTDARARIHRPRRRSASCPLSKGWHRTYWTRREHRKIWGGQRWARQAERAERPCRRARAAARGRARRSPACGELGNPLAGDDAAGRRRRRRRCRTSQPDSRGVITYATYQVAVARDGDTHGDAWRAGSAPRPTELARRNALPEDYMLRAGRGAAAARQRAAAAPAGLDAGAISTQPLGWSPSAPRRRSTAAPPADNPFQNGQTEPLIDPVRHRVEAGETAYSIARLYGVSVTALASWNGLGPDLAVRENQELLIPIVSDANRISSAPADTQPGQGTPVTRAAERRGAAAGRHHRRGRPALAEPRPVPHAAGRPAEPAGLRRGQPALQPGEPERRRLRGAGRHPGAGGGAGRGGADLRGARRARHHRAGPPPGRPDDHLLDARPTSGSSEGDSGPGRPGHRRRRRRATTRSCSSTSSAAPPASTRRPTSAADVGPCDAAEYGLRQPAPSCEVEGDGRRACALALSREV